MGEKTCKTLKDILHDPNFHKLVQVVHALNTAKKSLRDLIEKVWKRFIAGLPDTEKDQLSTFVRCFNQADSRANSTIWALEHLGCGHENCELLYTRLRNLSDTTTEFTAKQDDDISLQELEIYIPVTDNCLTFTWNLASCFSHAKPRAVKLQSRELNVDTLIRLMKHCRLFAFRDSEKLYRQILEDIESVVYARHLQILKEDKDKVFDHLSVLLSYWENQCKSCLNAGKIIKQNRHEIIDFENFESKLLVKNVLEMICDILNGKKIGSDLPESNIPSPNWHSSKEVVTTLLAEMKEMITEQEPNELLELKQKNDSLSERNRKLQTELDIRDSLLQKVQAELLETKQVNQRLKDDNMKIQMEVENASSSRDDERSKNKELEKKVEQLETELQTQIFGRESKKELENKVILLEKTIKCKERIGIFNTRFHYYRDSTQLEPPSNELLVETFGSFQDIVVNIDRITILFNPYGKRWAEDIFDDSDWDFLGKNRFDVVALSACMLSFSKLEVVKIAQKNPHVQWIIPTDRKELLIQQGVDPSKITEFRTWEKKTFNIHNQKITFVCSPTFKNIASSDSELCNTCGWIVKGSLRTFYCSGFTNYDETIFSRIKDHGPIDVALLPISYYSFNMSCSPDLNVEIEEIEKMHRNLQPCTSLGILHYMYYYFGQAQSRRSEVLRRLGERRFHWLVAGKPYTFGKS